MKDCEVVDMIKNASNGNLLKGFDPVELLYDELDNKNIKDNPFINTEGEEMYNKFYDAYVKPLQERVDCECALLDLMAHDRKTAFLVGIITGIKLMTI